MAEDEFLASVEQLDSSNDQNLAYQRQWRLVAQVRLLYCTVLYYTVLHYTVLYCTVLYCTILYYTVLYCIVLYGLYH